MPVTPEGMSEKAACSCGKPFPEDGGREGVCECCSTCVMAAKPRIVATIEVDGDSLHDVVNRLYDLAQRLDDPLRALPVQMVGGHHIVTVREADKAPKIDWREAEGV